MTAPASPSAPARPAAGRRRWLVTLAAFVAGILAAETMVRLCWPHEVDTKLLDERVAEFRLGEIKQFSADPVLYFELRPHLQTQQGLAKITTDAEGFRIPETPIAHLPGLAGEPVRIALIGPSTAFGWKVAYESTYGEQVRRKLEAQWMRPVELRNFGVPAYNSLQEERLLETKVLPWRPQLILWNYDHRDAYPLLSLNDPIGLPPEVGDNALHSALVKLAIRRWRERALEKTRYRDTAYTVHNNYLTSGSAFDQHLAALERVSQRVLDAKVPVVLFIHDAFIERLPADPGHFPELHQGLLARFAKMPGFRVLDLFPRFQEVMTERGWTDLKKWWISVLPQDGHPNPEAHAFVADELVKFIATMPDLPPK